MKIEIDRGNKNHNNAQNKQYGKLSIATTIKSNNGQMIDLADIKNVIAINHGKNHNTSNSNNVSSEPIKSKVKDLRVKASVNVNESMKVLKGQKININQNISNISNLIVALEWEVKGNVNRELDIDTSIFMVDKNNKTSEMNFIYYNNDKSVDAGVILCEDHRTGLKAGYDEVIQLDLNKVSKNIEKLAFTVTIYEPEERNQNFNNISDAYFSLIDAINKKEILRYRFDESFTRETAIVVSEIYRYKEDWKINFIGSGFNGGLEALCDNYGVETE